MQAPYQHQGNPAAYYAPQAPPPPAGADPVLKIALAVMAGVLTFQTLVMTVAHFAGQEWSDATWDALDYTNHISRLLIFGFAAFAVFRQKVSGGIMLASATFFQLIFLFVVIADQPPEGPMEEAARIARVMTMTFIYALVSFMVVLLLTIGVSQAVKAVANKSLLFFSIPALLIIATGRFTRLVLSAMWSAKVFDDPKTYKLMSDANVLFGRFGDMMFVGFLVAALVMSGSRRA